jgi:superoxide reductase
LTELNRPKDWENLVDMAKKHVPIIEAPAKVKAKETFTVKLKVGGIDGVEHPNILGHWIGWIELYAGDRQICRMDFAPEVSDGYSATIDAALNSSSTLIARSFCNLHGLWEGKEKEITVE